MLVNACYAEARRSRRWAANVRILAGRRTGRTVERRHDRQRSATNSSGAFRRLPLRAAGSLRLSPLPRAHPARGCGPSSASPSGQPSPGSTTPARRCDRPSTPMRERPPSPRSDRHDPTRRTRTSLLRALLADGPARLSDRVLDSDPGRGPSNPSAERVLGPRRYPPYVPNRDGGRGDHRRPGRRRTRIPHEPAVERPERRHVGVGWCRGVAGGGQIRSAFCLTLAIDLGEPSRDRHDHLRTP